MICNPRHYGAEGKLVHYLQWTEIAGLPWAGGRQVGLSVTQGE